MTVDRDALDYLSEVQHHREMLRKLDPTLDILWNRKLKRWVVVERRPELRPICGSLIGIKDVPENPLAQTNLNFLFVCEYPDEHPLAGLPIPLGPWLLKEVAVFCKRKGEKDPMKRMEEAEALAKKEMRRVELDMIADNKSEIGKFYTRGARHFVMPGATTSR